MSWIRKLPVSRKRYNNMVAEWRRAIREADLLLEDIEVLEKEILMLKELLVTNNEKPNK